MYKLYEMSIVSEIDRSENEGDIIDTIGEYLSYDPNCTFLIKKDEELYRSIRSIKAYIDYVEEYNQRIKDMSCIELKKEIVNRDKTLSKRR